PPPARLLALASTVVALFLVYCSGHPRHLHSFPTRRSSDLTFSGTAPADSTVTIAGDIKATAKADGNGKFSFDAPAKAGSFDITLDRKSTRLNSSHVKISYAVFCLKKKKKNSKDTHSQS